MIRGKEERMLNSDMWRLLSFLSSGVWSVTLLLQCRGRERKVLHMHILSGDPSQRRRGRREILFMVLR